MTPASPDRNDVVKAAWVLAVALVVSAVIVVGGLWFVLHVTLGAVSREITTALREELSQTLAVMVKQPVQVRAQSPLPVWAAYPVQVQGPQESGPPLAVQTTAPINIESGEEPLRVKTTDAVEVTSGEGSPLNVRVPEALTVQGLSGNEKPLQVETGLPMGGQ